MMERITRRETATLLVSAAVTGRVLAQQPAQGTSDPLAAAREKQRAALAEMEQVDLPMPAEPAFVFQP